MDNSVDAGQPASLKALLVGLGILTLAVSCMPAATPEPAMPVPPSEEPATCPPTTRPTITSTEKPMPAPTCAADTATPLPTVVPSETPVPPTVTPAPSAASLRECGQVYGVHIGTAVAAHPLRGDPRYAQTVAETFSMVTPENGMKFGPIHPAPDQYTFADADFIVDFAQAHGLQVRGHTLVWHNQLPGWVNDGNWSKESLMDVLREHIHTVVGRYRGRVVAWDVVNEAFEEDGSLRDTIWLRVIGPEYIELAFRWAHEADPDALLFYNDFNAEGLCPKSDAVYALVTDLLDRGVPIHGVGFQTHVSLDWCPDASSVAANIDRLSALGLQVHITEMDVRIPEPATEEKLHEQAAIFEDMLRVCLSARNCTAFVLWGVTDNHSWIPQFFPGYGSALILDGDYNAKPACKALEDVVTGN